MQKIIQCKTTEKQWNIEHYQNENPPSYHSILKCRFFRLLLSIHGH